MCAWLAIADHLRIVFVVGTFFGLQMVYLHLRTKRLTGPVIDDDEIKARVSPPLIELCAMVGVPAPHVRIQRSMISVAMTSYKNDPLLCISPDFLEVVDDRALRAVIAHELIHQKHGDMAAGKKRGAVISLAAYGLFVAIYLTAARGDLIALAVYFAFLFPTMRLIGWATGFSWQRRESRADIEGAAAANDPEASVRGLQLVYGLVPRRRRMIYGPPGVRWLFLPYSLRPTTHPPMGERVSAIQALTLNEDSPVVATVVTREPGRDRTRVVLGTIVIVMVAGLIYGIHRDISGPSISLQVESPGGAHFVPVQDLGIPTGGTPATLRWFFLPLTDHQVHQVTTTAKQALATADAAHKIHAGDGVTSLVAEGSFAGVSIIGLGGPSPSAATGVPAYLVVLQGADIKDPTSPGVNDLCVVVVKATNDTIDGTYYYSANPN
jgi:Zn-dependent protease with chaperone function